MYTNWNFRNMDDGLPSLANFIMTQGYDIDSRAGKTRDVIHVGITLTEPLEREITLPDRKHNLAAQIAETMWVLAGRDGVDWLARYLPRAPDFSDDGQVWRGAYGKRLRRWPSAYPYTPVYLDQLEHVVRLLREDPNTRRAVIAIYDPEVDMQPGKDIPCNDFLTFSCRNGLLDLGVTIRSNDLIWGWSGVNVFEWSTLLEIVAGLVGVEVGCLHFATTSLHIYDRHWEKCRGMRFQLEPAVKPSPRFLFPEEDVAGLDKLFSSWFAIEAKMAQGDFCETQVDHFPEPMLQSWLRVLQWWWSGDRDYLAPLQGTRLEASALVAVQPPVRQERPLGTERDAFADYVTTLHSEKHAAYGDSWKRRGEMLAILANIARKIDRLGGGATADETSADTAIDLLVYLAKYRWWLFENDSAPTPVSHIVGGEDPATSNALIRRLDGPLDVEPVRLAAELEVAFANLEDAVMAKSMDRWQLVDEMMPLAYSLAYQRWVEQQ